MRPATGGSGRVAEDLSRPSPPRSRRRRGTAAEPRPPRSRAGVRRRRAGPRRLQPSRSRRRRARGRAEAEPEPAQPRARAAAEAPLDEDQGGEAGDAQAEARPATTGDRKPIVRLPKPEHERGRRQERRGVVVSEAMDKTIVVKVDTVKAHPRYKKVVRRSRKFHAHDERNTAQGRRRRAHRRDAAAVEAKNWRLAEIVEAAR